MERGRYVAPYRSKKTSVSFKGERMHHVVTYTPSSANAGDTLYVHVPRPEKLVIVPGTLALTFDMEVVLDPSTPGDDVNTYVVENLAANIVSQYKVKIGTETVYDLNHAHLYNTFKDLWLSRATRKNSVFKGIQTLTLRKIRTDLQSTMSAKSTPDVVTVRDIFGKRYSLPLDCELIKDHQPISANQDILFELTINNKEYVINYKNATTADFTLKNIRLEYDTIFENELTQKIDKALDSGVSYLFDHAHHYKCEPVNNSDTLVNVEVSGFHRKSLKGILLLFQDDFKAGERDSEKFANPKISSIKLTIDSVPNKLYSGGYKEENQWHEICKYFASEDYKISNEMWINVFDYYGQNHFGLWVDLRTTEDNNLHGSGKIQEAKNNILMEISKKDTGTGKCMMHIFVISDARVTIQDMNKTVCFEH